MRWGSEADTGGERNSEKHDLPVIVCLLADRLSLQTLHGFVCNRDDAETVIPKAFWLAMSKSISIVSLCSARPGFAATPSPSELRKQRLTRPRSPKESQGKPGTPHHRWDGPFLRARRAPFVSVLLGSDGDGQHMLSQLPCLRARNNRVSSVQVGTIQTSRYRPAILWRRAGHFVEVGLEDPTPLGTQPAHVLWACSEAVRPRTTARPQLGRSSSTVPRYMLED